MNNQLQQLEVIEHYNDMRLKKLKTSYDLSNELHIHHLHIINAIRNNPIFKRDTAIYTTNGHMIYKNEIEAYYIICDKLYDLFVLHFRRCENIIDKSIEITYNRLYFIQSDKNIIDIGVTNNPTALYNKSAKSIYITKPFAMASMIMNKLVIDFAKYSFLKDKQFIDLEMIDIINHYEQLNK